MGQLKQENRIGLFYFHWLCDFKRQYCDYLQNQHFKAIKSISNPSLQHCCGSNIFKQPKISRLSGLLWKPHALNKQRIICLVYQFPDFCWCLCLSTNLTNHVLSKVAIRSWLFLLIPKSKWRERYQRYDSYGYGP